MSTIPNTTEEILATGIINPDFEAAWKARGSPPGDMPADVATLKRLVDASLPGLQSELSASRPPDITETEHSLPLSTGFTSRILVCRQAAQHEASPSPIIVLFHGGIHVLGHPEFDLRLARRLARAHNATVVCPSTRKAPEHPFPAMIDDAWAILQAIARDALSAPAPQQQRALLPALADARAGFVLGGTSSGANFADVLAHLARDARLAPAVTGLALVCGAFVDGPEHVPDGYRERYLSRRQNRDAPVMNERFLRAFREAVRPDPRSPLWAPFLQRREEVGDAGGGVGVAEGHKGMPPVYFQVCGLDVNRDDSLMYERLLREECGVATRMDLYAGFPHCWWDMYPDLEASKTRMRDMVNGVGWLLGKECPAQELELTRCG